MCVRIFILVSLTPYKQFPKFPILKLLESKQCVMLFAWERLEKFPFLTDSQHLQSSPYLFGAGRSGKLFLTVLLILPLFLPKQWEISFFLLEIGTLGAKTVSCKSRLSHFCLNGKHPFERSNSQPPDRYGPFLSKTYIDGPMTGGRTS